MREHRNVAEQITMMDRRIMLLIDEKVRTDLIS
jgi:hypothetical protein